MYVCAHIRISFLIKKFILHYFKKCLLHLCTVEREQRYNTLLIAVILSRMY